MNDSYVQVLQRAKSLIDTPDKWIKGDFAVNANDEYVSTDHPDACKFCMLGAIDKAYEKNYSLTALHEIQYIVGSIIEPDETYHDKLYRAIYRFNDSGSTNHSMVMKLFDDAIQAAKGQ